MIVGESTVTTRATPERVWECCEDPNLWPTWDPAMEWVKFDGLLRKDATGTLKVKGGQTIHFTVPECDKPYRFVTVNKWPGARLVFTHEATVVHGVTTITNRIELNGFLKFIYRLLVGRAVRRGLPIALNNLIRLAEEEQPSGASVKEDV